MEIDRASEAKRKLVEACGVTLLVLGVVAVGVSGIAVMIAASGELVGGGGLMGFLAIRWGWCLLMHPENPWRVKGPW